jgi:hypothetical protein
MLIPRGLIISSHMRDEDVRRVLRIRLAAVHAHDEGALVLEELGLCRGTVRVDMAVVNGALKGYEIKSERDTLVRLETQASIYSQVFDTVTLVVAQRHLSAAEAIVPPWWGIEVATCDSLLSVTLATVRKEEINPSVDARSLVQLLWRDEVLEILDRWSPSKPLCSKPRRVLWEYLANVMPLPDLKEAVRAALKSRTKWRVDDLQKPSGEKFPLSSMWSDSRVPYVRQRTRRYSYRPN